MALPSRRTSFEHNSVFGSTSENPATGDRDALVAGRRSRWGLLGRCWAGMCAVPASDEHSLLDYVRSGAGRRYVSSQRLRGISSAAFVRAEDGSGQTSPSSARLFSSQCDRLVISPKSRWKLTFDLFVLLSIVYTAIAMPVKASPSPPTHPPSSL